MLSFLSEIRNDNDGPEVPDRADGCSGCLSNVVKKKAAQFN